MPRSDPAGDKLAEMLVNKPTRMQTPKVAEPDAARPPHITQPSEPPPAPPPKTAYWAPTLAWVQDHGFTHPSWGGWLQLPREFDAILAMERKAVAQVVLEIMRRTLGWVDPTGDVDEQGRPKRVEWAHIDYEHFIAICGGSTSQARSGLKIALEKNYIERERIKVALERGYIDRDDLKKNAQGGGFVYRIRWNSPKTFP
jgi:hypothetical protein